MEAWPHSQRVMSQLTVGHWSIEKPRKNEGNHFDLGFGYGRDCGKDVHRLTPKLAHKGADSPCQGPERI